MLNAGVFSLPPVPVPVFPGWHPDRGGLSKANEASSQTVEGSWQLNA
jgi:hypothetical protein